MTRSDGWLVGALALAFVPALLALAEVWRSVPHYSHGFLIPAVAAYVAWAGRARVLALPAVREPWGLALLALALLAYLLGLGAGHAALQGAALVGAVAALVLALRGAAWLRELAFPTGFLLFMVPLPAEWLTRLIVGLQLLVSASAVAILQGLGVAVAREGNVILLSGGESLFVAEACSGVTSLVTLTPLAVLLAYFTERGLLRRLLLVAFVVPLALGGNLFRVVGTVLAAQTFGVARATESVLHEMAGLLVYLGCCIALLLCGALMRRFLPATPSGAGPTAAPAGGADLPR